MSRIIAIVSLVMTLTPNSAIASAFFDGNELHKYCSKDLAFCDGYVAGVVDLDYGRTICSPDNVTTGQMIDVAKKFLADHPEHRHNSGSSLVLAALSESFPC